MKKYVSLDIGGTAIKYGLIDENGVILEKGSTATEAQKGGAAILKKAIDIVEAYRCTNEISGICISSTGMVDPKRGEIIYAGPTVPNYKGTKLKESMENRFGVCCEVENDVNCANLAEFVSGASAGSKTSVMLTVGTGIGASLIINGEIYNGWSNSACEVGYMHLGDGDFQTLGAASVLTKKVAERKQESTDSWNGLRIFEEAQKGDAVCCQAIDEMADVLGKGIANICYVVNPQVVVLGGGIMAQEAFLKEKVETSVRRYLVPILAENTKILFAKHKNDAGILGAFYHFCRCQKAEGE
ncbi:MAG: ROK family protein [Lachnospiraceae bacterium]|nr:ROK family protein [Lachnospiraceae bacterium]